MPAKRKARLTARTADKYVLYTDAVQSPEAEVTFFEHLYNKLNGRPPVRVREDFCGTAAICCQWAHVGENNIATGIDLDPEPLEWSKNHYIALLPRETARRVRLRQADVLRVRSRKQDVVLALNFSYCVFKERATMLKYFRRVRGALADGGVFILDIYGGPEGQRLVEEHTTFKGYTYIWDQARYNPITAEALNHIHFHFRDGSRMRKAFTYDWRLWTIPELMDLLEEAGFQQARCYWENTNKDGEGTGVYRYRRVADADEAWIAYVVGIK